MPFGARTVSSKRIEQGQASFSGPEQAGKKARWAWLQLLIDGPYSFFSVRMIFGCKAEESKQDG
jgi:hypothetical protein